ncbi:M3 family metallopeptidase [Roseateles terrae]|uniref:Peptidyl-dipeptidase Dcp n=1 Tax=Roseateles terrae TaxID=431060 RepID=A0ABR6GPW0_9BURK|nr:M3 family metallopeptidase [Roseateles terrae]MBB3194160.1 peptidyl-dipeptidase Dcp [Roseateles terrae]OWQ88015.1 peptidase M3 [Roseateles terrae]
MTAPRASSPSALSTDSNPLLNAWAGPYGLPPFADIRVEHFEPAFDQALAEHRAELALMASQNEAPSFDNTVAAFDRSGRRLVALEHLFSTLSASATSPELQAAQRRLAAPLAAHSNAVYMNAALFARMEVLFEQRDTLGLDPQQRRLLERIHLDFVRAGARMQGEARRRYASLMERLAELHTRFAQNVLADEGGYQLVLRTDDELAGLPDFVRAAARQAALDRAVSDPQAHVITLSRSLIVPFLTFSERRDLREQAWRAWVSRGEHSGDSDNREIIREILRLRQDQARLHGYATYADYALADTMAGRPSAVQGLLDQVWEPAKAAVERERAMLDAERRRLGHAETIEDWDWRYYAEKVRQQRYQLDESEVKPYFPLEAMVQAMFDCAQRLYGLHFVPQPHVAGYHPDVKVYEVRQADGHLRGLFVQDNFARPTKRSGAWMNALRWQARNGIEALPIILNNNNFAKGAPGEPTLLSFDDTRTLFHEFGHGLHGLLSQVEFERLSGTQVLRDFVELPSQLMEHWMAEPAVLKRHARHYRTGEPIPDALLDKIKAAATFNQGYETVRYCASALVDQAVHALPAGEVPDLVAFERDTLQRLGAPAAVGMNHRLTHFQHLFSGSFYAAQYYVYLWAEVLDCDAYEAFVEAGDPFDAATAKSLLDNVLAVGNSREPGATYRAFRGRDAEVGPMLKGRGLLPA